MGKIAIFAGSLANGFDLVAVGNAAEEAALLASFGKTDRIIDAVEVSDPRDRNKNAESAPDGMHYVVYEKGMSSGFTVYGPFSDCDIAGEFAEDNRGEDEEWEVFDLQPRTADSLADMEVRKVLVLATRHLTPQTLSQFKQYPWIGDFEYGAYYHVPRDYSFDDIRSREWPADLIKVLQFAREHGCSEVKFDQDGDSLPALPSYEEIWAAIALA